MGLIIQQRALQAAGGLRQVLPVVRKRDRSLFDQIHRAMNSVVLNIAEADGNDAGSGWIIAAGGDVPMRIMGNEFFPKARVYFGSIKDAVGGDVSLLALEFKGTVRVNF